MSDFTGNGTLVRNGIIYGGSHDTDAVHWSDNSVLGAKNIFPNRATSQTLSGVTFTVNDDGTITANGTYESSIPYLLSDGWGSTDVEWIKPFEGQSVCISGSVVGVTFAIRFYDENNVALATIDTDYDGDEIVGVIPTNIAKYEAYLFPNGLHTFTDVVFKPMVRLATDTDDTYVPYAMTNRELAEKLTASPTYKSLTYNGIIINFVKVGYIVYGRFDGQATSQISTSDTFLTPTGTNIAIRPKDAVQQFIYCGTNVTWLAADAQGFRFTNRNVEIGDTPRGMFSYISNNADPLV